MFLVILAQLYMPLSIDVMNIVVDVMNTTIIYAFVVMQMVNNIIPLKDIIPLKARQV
jgi:hypothetical protein